MRDSEHRCGLPYLARDIVILIAAGAVIGCGIAIWLIF